MDFQSQLFRKAQPMVSALPSIDAPPNPFDEALGNLPADSPGIDPASSDSGAAGIDEAPKDDSASLGRGAAIPPLMPAGAPAATAGAPEKASGSAPQRAPFGGGFTQREHGIKNPVLRTLAEIGDVAGSSLFPGITAMIPGSRLNEERAQGIEQGREKTQAGIEHEEAETAKDKAEAQKALTPEQKTAFELWQQQHPGQDVSKWLEMEQGAKPDKTQNPEEQAFASLIAKGVDPMEAFKQVKTVGQKPDKPERPDTPEQQFLDEFQRLNKGATVAQAEAAYQKLAHPPADKTDKNTARSDKSYQYNDAKLDKLGQPVEQIAQRLGRLQDTISQNSPQADALIAPELMTVMAGGQGSGLRMNEAEISRVVGGRSNWESLKASANKWKLDPKEALSITPEQRQEIRALVGAVHAKLMQKQQILDQGREQLLDSDDPKEHRRIVADIHKKLTAIDEGGGEQNTTRFQVGSEKYDIPTDKKDAFLKQHPDAKQIQ